MKNALIGTPWWAYLLFFYLLYVGLDARKPRVISLIRLFIIPLGFTIWSFLTIGTAFDSSSTSKIALWVIGLCLGSFFGWLLTRKIQIRADKNKMLMKTPGSWMTLILVMAIFSVKYFFGYSFATNPASKANLLFFISHEIISGLVTGMFVGRLITYLKKYRRAPHEDLRVIL